jgi:hypothetical protein
MIHLALLVTLAVHPPPQTMRFSSIPDTSRRPDTTEVHRVSQATRPARDPFEWGQFLKQETILDRMLSLEENGLNPADSINALLKSHPELRELVLRELLMPSPRPGFFASSPPSQSDVWRLTGNYRMSEFERNGLIQAREAALRDRWTDARIFIAQVNILSALLSLLGLFLK